MLPASTGPAAAVFVTDTSACVAERVVTVAVLLARLGSEVAAVTFAVLVIVVPAGVLGDTRTTTVKLAEAPSGSVAMVPLIVPVPPTAGLVKVNVGPEICASETKVVLAGTMSVSATVWASLGPAFATVMCRRGRCPRARGRPRSSSSPIRPPASARSS